MCGARSANVRRGTEVADEEADQRLERVLKHQRILAWALSGLTFAMTVGFFALMGTDAPLLSRIAVGRSISIANVLAAALILIFLASIALFGWRAARIDEHLRDRKRAR
jgi:uncharacterized membrane protein (DUF485 family)